jgi:hypothetical protein
MHACNDELDRVRSNCFLEVSVKQTFSRRFISVPHVLLLVRTTHARRNIDTSSNFFPVEKLKKTLATGVWAAVIHRNRWYVRRLFCRVSHSNHAGAESITAHMHCPLDTGMMDGKRHHHHGLEVDSGDARVISSEVSIDSNGQIENRIAIFSKRKKREME